MNELKQWLSDVYGGPADKRIKKVEKMETFIADDRDMKDMNSKGELYGPFCPIFIIVKGDDSINVRLDNCPISDSVRSCCETYNFDLSERAGSTPKVWINLKLGEQQSLKPLADAIGSIVSSGKGYSNPSYKYSCPRVKKSLLKIIDVLDKFQQRASATV